MKRLALLSVVFCACSSAPPAGQDAGPGGGAGGGQGGGTGLACDGGLTACAGQCVDTATSDLHCGTCDHGCTPQQACAASQCLPLDCSQAQCADYQVCLNELCVDRACVGVICPSGLTCARGQCFPSACGTMTCGTGEVCENNSCVEAACAGVICPANQRCHAGACVALGCFDNLQNGSETAVDCGGTCTGCRVGEGCLLGSDCQSGACDAGRCSVGAGCSNSVRDGTELAVDCGGGQCPGCAPGVCGCRSTADCQSTACTNGCCMGQSCVDNVQSGTETDKDCGGGACPACADGLRCAAGTDCSSKVCTLDGGVCAAPSCADTVKNGHESDTDCGGDGGCAPCATGKACADPADCVSRSCSSQRCDALACNDSAKNGSETDVDCGGACPACQPGQQCLLPADCTSKVCAGGVCQTPSCNDGVRNGSEQGVDCGGSCYPCGFARPVAWPLGSGDGPRGVVAADFNGDGKVDLATCNYNSTNVSVLLGNGDGTFQVAQQYSTGRAGYGCVAAEVSGDANLDLLVHTDPDTMNNNVFILVGNGDGTFGLPVGVTAGSFFDRSMVFTDLNGDGQLDIASGQNSRIDVSFGNGNLTFNPASIFFAAGYVNSLAAGDFTGDGRVDLVAQVATGSVSAQVVLIAQQADGGFPRVDVAADGGLTAPSHLLAGVPGGNAMWSADVNRDGRADLVASGAGAVFIAYGQGDGGFVNGPNLGTAACTPAWLSFGDVNPDSGLDIVGSCGSASSGGLGVNFAVGAVFQQTVLYVADGGAPAGTALGDFNRDGRPDVAVADMANRRVLIYLNKP